jgi:hypothetical protein
LGFGVLTPEEGLQRINFFSAYTLANPSIVHPVCTAIRGISDIHSRSAIVIPIAQLKFNEDWREQKEYGLNGIGR